MVITRQQNATVEANPSVTKFSKEQNDLKMKELQEYAAINAVDQYLEATTVILLPRHLSTFSATPRIQLRWL